MKVRTNSTLESDLTFTQGKEYLVVGIEANCYRVLDDNNDPALLSKSQVDVTDPEVPNDWVWVHADYDETVMFANPAGLGDPGFYEDYFDEKDYAIKRFQEYVDSIGLHIQARPYHPQQTDPPRSDDSGARA